MKFNTRQLKYRQYRLAGMTSKAAALKAGYSAATAHSGKVDNLCDIATALEIAGFTSRGIAEKTFQRFNDDDGMIGHKYLETALKLMGARGYTQDKAASLIDKAVVNIYVPQVPDSSMPLTNPSTPA